VQIIRSNTHARAVQSRLGFLVKGDLGRLLVHVHVLGKGAIQVVRLLLDGRAELEEVLRHGLVSTPENVDQPIQQCKYLYLKGSLGAERLTSQSGPCPGQ
jgi:hypothetical protein